MKRWPWFTTIVSVAFALSPVGQAFLYGAFGSSEALSRNIAQLLVCTAILILVALGLLEWWAGRLLRRRAHKAPLD